MARLSSRDWNKKQKDFEKENLRRAANTVKAEAREKQRTGHIAGAMETADTNAKLYRVAQMAADVRQQSRKGSKDYRQADRLFKSAVNSENRYRDSVNRTLENRANTANNRANTGTNRANAGITGRTNESKPNNVFDSGDYRTKLMMLSQKRAEGRYQNQLKQREDERKAYLYKYGDVEHMSYSELKNRISKLESEKAQRKTERGDNDANMMGAAGGGVSSIINGNQGISPARRETLDKLDKDADDKIAEYKKALPAAAIRSEEEKITEDEKKAIMAVADNVRKNNHSFATAMNPSVGYIENNINEKLKQPLESLKKKGVDVDYLVDAYGAMMDNADAERDARASKDFAKESVGNAILSSAATVLASPATMVSGIGEDISHALRNTFGDKPLPVNQKNRWLSNNTEAIRGGVSEEIENPIWNFVYNAGMSAGDSAMALLTGSAIGGAVGAGAKIGTKATQFIMSAGAADSTYNEAIERGIDPMNALATAVTAGVAEWVTEKYSIDNLKALATKQPKTFKELVKNIGKQMVTEGSEEAASDVMNTIADNIINGKKSVFEQSVRSYLDRGLTEEQARKAAMMDWLGNTAYDAAAGAFSGALMGVGGQALSFKQVQNNFSSYGDMVHKTGDINQVIDYAKRFNDLEKEAGKLEKVKFTDKESERAGRLADTLQEKIEGRIGEATNAVELTDTYNELSEDAPDIIKANIDDAVLRKAEELKGTNENESEQYVLSQITEEARGSLERTLDTISTKIETSSKEDEKVSSQDLGEGTTKEQAKQIKVHGNTQARLAASGESVNIDGFVNIGTDNVGIRIDGNDVVPIDSLVFDDPRVEGLYHAAASMDDEAAASAMVSGYNGRMDAATYFGDFEKAYNWGSIGYDFDEMYKRSPFSISKDIAYQAYALGHNAYEASYEEALNRSENVRTGKTSFRQGEGKVINERRDAEDLEKGVYEHIDEKLAKKLGINIREVDQTNKDINEKINGFLDINNAEMVFSDAAQSDFGVRIHESMEFLDAVDPATYDSLMKFVLLYAMNRDSKTSNDDIYNTIMAYRETYRGVEGNKTFAEAAGEYLNDAVSGVFFSEEGAKDFLEWLNKEDISESEKKGILQTILDIIDKLIKALTEALDRSHMTKAQRHAASVKLETQKEIRQMFFDAMEYGAKTYKGSAGENVEQGKAASAKAYSMRADINNKYVKKVSLSQNNRKIEAIYDVLEAYKKENAGKIGKITRDSEKYRDDLHLDEINGAKALSKLGIDVILRQESDKEYVKNPDYEIFKALWDLKNPKSESSTNKRVQEGFIQIAENPGGVVLDFGNKDIDMDEMWRQVENRINVSGKADIGVFIIRNGEVVGAREYKLKKETTPRPNGPSPASNNNIAHSEEKASEISENGKKSLSLAVDTEGRELTPEQQEFFKDSKILDDNGRLRVVYHGTNNTEFNIFDSKYVGSASGDVGFFGKGFYFAFTEGEAAYYGSKRIIPVYLNITNPFDFEKELHSYNGEEAVYGYAPDAVSFMNFAEKFPEIAEGLTISVGRAGSDAIEEISLKEFADAFRDVIDNKKFEYRKRKNEYGNEETIVTADQKEIEYEYNGKTHTHIYYDFEERFNSDAPHLDVAYAYLSKCVYSYVDMYNFTKVILENSDDFTESLKKKGYDGTIQSKAGDEAVAFYPEQIKNIDNENPTENQDIRFSLKVPVEETKNLIAVHNLSESKLMESLNLGGFPMPSIAITKRNMNHENFGDISVVFRKETIDPANADNTVYSSDAYTARFPEIAYVPDEDALGELAEELGTSISSLEANAFSRGSKEDIVRGLSTMPEVRNKFIKDENIKVTPAKRIPDTSMLENGEIGAKIAVYLITNGLSFKDLVENKKSREEVLSIARGDENSAAFAKRRRTARANMIEKRLLKAAEDKESFKKFEAAFNKDIDIINGTAEEEDYEGGYRDGVNNAIKEHREEFDKYVGEMADRVRVTPWIRNQKDRFNRDGSERSFNELHLEYTLDNIVNAMRALGDEAVESASPYGMFTGASTDKLSSIDDIHAEEGRIAEMSPEEYDEVTKAYAERFLDIAKEIANDPDDFYVVDGTAEGIVEALKSSKTKQGVLKALKEYSDNVTPAAVDKIFELKDEIRRMPTKYLEAKPKRAVGLDEIAGVAIPSDASKELKAKLKEKNIPFETYDEYNGMSRVDAVNSFDGIHFSIDVDTKELIRENAQLKEMVKHLEHEFELTGGKEADPEKVKRVAKKFLKMFNSSYDLDTLADQIMNIYSYLHSENGDGEVALAKMSEVAKSILKEGGDKIEGEYKELRDYLRTTGISLSEAQKEEAANIFGSYGAFRKAMFGKVKLTNNGADLERIWNADLKNLAPELFLSDVNALNMPAVLADTVDAIQPRVTPYGTEDIEQGAYDVAMQIYTELAKVPPVETFADKQEKKYIEGMNKLAESYEGLLDAYRKEIDTLNNADIEAAKEQFEQEKKVRLAKNTSEMKAILEAKKQARNPKTLADYEKKFKALEQENQRLRLAKADEVAKIKAKYNAKRLSDIDRRKSTETKDKIRKLHDRMRRMIIKPTETAYVPKDLMAAAIEVCNIVDLGYAEGTKLRKALDEARRAFPNVDKEDGILASDFDPRIADEIDTLTELFDNKPDGWSIKDASLEELNRIYDAMNGIYECIRMSTKLIREEGEKDARRAGKKVIKELEESKGLNTWLGKLSDKVTSSFLNSYREFRKISGYNDNGEIMFMWKELNEGQKKMYRAQMEGQEVLQKAFGSKEMDNLLKKLNSPKDLVRVPLRFKSGNAPVMITRGMRLSLIMHGMSAANYRHMSVGGIEIPVNMKLIDNKQKAYEHTRRVVGIDYTALKQMEMELSTEEKKLLEVMKKLFHEWSGEKINETSNELYGFERARVKGYFPISVDKDYVATDISSLKFDKTIEGAGFLKERIQSVKPIILENIMDTAERTIKATSLFNGLAVPVRNYNKIMNTTTYEVTEADEGDGEIWVPNTSVKKMLKDKWGLRAQQYLDDLVADLQQARNREYTWYDRLRGNYAGAVLTANASVIIKQTSAYPTVAGIVGWMPTVKAMFRGGKNNWMLSKADTDLINKWSSLYWYRNQGNNSRDLAEIRDMNSFVNKVPPIKFTKDLIQKVDIAMVGRFWYAAQYYVDKNFKNLEKGSDAYYKKVAEYFDRSIEETQSTNMVMENADIMRNPSGGMKMITMFMGQGLQNFGIVYDNLANMRAKARMVKEGKATKAEFKQARKDFANAVTSQLVSAAMFAGLAIVARGLLHRMNPYRDDKEEITAESIATKFADDMAENIAGSIPFGSLIYEGVMAATDVASGKGFTRTYGQQDIVLDAISTLETDTVKLAKAIKKVIDGEESAVWDALNQTIKDGSKLFGIPYENIWNLGEGFTKHVSDVASGDGFLSYSSDQKDPSVSVIGGYLNEAIENGDTYSQEKYAETLYELGKSDKEINSQIAKNIKGDEAIINAAAARNSGDIATYSQTVVDYVDKGYPEAAVVSAITSVINSMNKKPKQDVIIDTGKIKKENGSFMNSIKNTDAKVYDSGDLTAAVEGGNVRNINAIVNALLKEKTDKGLSKEDAVKELSKSMKSTLSRQYHQMYLGSSMAERSKIIDKLSKVKLDGKPLYDQEHFLRWNKEAEKSP